MVLNVTYLTALLGWCLILELIRHIVRTTLFQNPCRRVENRCKTGRSVIQEQQFYNAMILEYGHV